MVIFHSYVSLPEGNGFLMVFDWGFNVFLNGIYTSLVEIQND
jgi:hypothetical protein